MRRKAILGVAILGALLLLTSSLPNRVTANPANYRAVGVTAGVTANYQFKTNMGGMMDLVVASHFFIVGIQGTNITYARSWEFPNGSTYSLEPIRTENISIVQGISPRLWIYLVPAGLAIGDPVTIGSTYKINQTFTATYAGATRTVNNMSYLFAGVSSYDQYDRDTGLVVKHILYLGGGQWENFTLTSTNAWSASPMAAQPTIDWLAIGIGAVVGAVVGLAIGIVVARRRGK